MTWSACGAALALALTLPVAGQDADDLPPAGFGTLRQEDIAIRLQTATMRVSVMPLAEPILRLLTDDSYSALHQLVRSRDSAVTEAARRAGVQSGSLFLVSFFGLERGVTFNPDDLLLESRNRYFRPIATVPITPQWGTHRLEQRETAVAIYLFEADIALWERLVVSFAGTRNASWERTLRVLERERAAVQARAAAARPDSGPDPP